MVYLVDRLDYDLSLNDSKSINNDHSNNYYHTSFEHSISENIHSSSSSTIKSFQHKKPTNYRKNTTYRRPNDYHRHYRYKKLQQENQRLYQRISKIKPKINFKKFKQDEIKFRKLVDNRSMYPYKIGIWNKSSSSSYNKHNKKYMRVLSKPLYPSSKTGLKPRAIALQRYKQQQLSSYIIKEEDDDKFINISDNDDDENTSDDDNIFEYNLFQQDQALKEQQAYDKMIMIIIILIYIHQIDFQGIKK